VEFFA